MQWKTGEKRLESFKTFPGMFEVTPVMAAGTLYLSTPYNRVVALDPERGASVGPTILKRTPMVKSRTERDSSIAACLWRDSQSEKLRVS